MSDDSKSSSKSESKSSSDSGAASSAPSTERKLGREAMGGASAGHYGFFSNIKSPEYKSGWDDIWGKKKKSSSGSGAKKAAPKEPVTVAVAFRDLPPAARKALAEAAKAKLGRSKAAYDKADKAETLSWTIEVTVPR